MPKRKEYQTTGTEPVYDEFYNRFRMQSAILKGQNTFQMNISDKAGCESALSQLLGNSSKQPGYYHDANANKYKLALLPSLELDEKLLNQAWLDHQRKHVNSGRRPLEDKLQNWPQDLREKLLKTQARIDVAQEEVTALKKWLLTFTDAKKKGRELLRYGPKGTFHTDINGVIKDIDGQTVTMVNGWPTITEPDSPYNNVATADYFDTIIPAFRQQQKAKAWDRLTRMQERARNDGLPIPKNPPMMAGSTIPPDELPKLRDFPQIKLNLPKPESESSNVTE